MLPCQTGQLAHSHQPKTRDLARRCRESMWHQGVAGSPPSPGGTDCNRRPERRARVGQPRGRAARSLCTTACAPGCPQPAPAPASHLRHAHMARRILDGHPSIYSTMVPRYSNFQIWIPTVDCGLNIDTSSAVCVIIYSCIVENHGKWIVFTSAQKVFMGYFKAIA